MTTVPRYWYVEPGGYRLSLEEGPDFVGLGPVPARYEAVLVDGSTGEIHGEAILMCALPWPRFRGLRDGQEVILPGWHAETLERMELEVGAIVSKSACPNCGGKLHDWTRHVRIEVSGDKVKAFYAHRCGSILDEFGAVSTRQSGPAAGQRDRETSGPSARLQSGAEGDPSGALKNPYRWVRR